ncbi:stage V sporulation protein AD [Alteribacillus sp. HJP-4]|uniref:stage V sporulation protein AD n=1 Tax=Alteribacillus sp. HJP-4 TaxID=2775394 RepID=UPI0035CD1F94
MLQGKQSWVFENTPVITAAGTAGGPFEAEGRLTSDFDYFFDDLWMEEKSFEKAQKRLFEKACETAITKSGLKESDIQFVLCGDLINQMTSSSFACRTLSIPYIGLFGACSTSMEGLALAGFIINNNGADYVLTGTSSHNAATEKQFRYPTEYGSQKPPTSQWTATAAGAVIVSKNGTGPSVTAATVGKVIDMGLKDPFNMGGAMAPAAADTIEAHFNDLNRGPDDYDLIITGDLGKVGNSICQELLKEKGYQVSEKKFNDCGMLLYNEDQPVQAGASGTGCSASVVYGHILNRLKNRELNKILVVATGALLSPLSYQQKESIPCIAHAVVIENKGEVR